jgi:hypothetical protein
LIVAAAVALAPSAAAYGQKFDELVKRVPAGANALVLLNVDQIFNSPKGIQQNWKTKHEQRYAAGLSAIPPDAMQAIFATQMDLQEMAPQWESSIMRLDANADMSNLATMSGGKLDTVGSYKAVALPTDAYAVQFAPDLVGVMAPTDRQSVGRWIRETDAAKRPDLSPYLTEAYGYANQLGTPIILAIDLENIHSPDEVLASLKASDKFADQPAAELERLAKMFAGIRGLTLGVTFADRPFGKVKVDFSDNVGIPPELAKVMLLHALSKRGAMLSELQDWKPTVTGPQITLEGYLTSSGLKRIFSLFDRPPSFEKVPEAPPASAANHPEPPPPTALPPLTAPAENPASTGSAQSYFNDVAAAQAFFKRITGDISDLRSGSGDATTLGGTALWYDSYARRIDELPVLGIDPELVAYAQRTADALRQASSVVRGVDVQMLAREASPRRVYVTQTQGLAYKYSYGWHGRNGTGRHDRPYVTNNYTVVNRSKPGIRHEETAKAGASASQIMQQIDEDTAATRQKLSLKYKVNF